MKQLLIYLFGFYLATSMLYGQTKTIEPNQLVLFKAKFSGLTANGTIKGLSGTLIFDEQDLAKAYFDVSLDATSVTTDNKTRDGHLQKEDYFDGAKYPKIAFKSIKIERTASGFVATGNLTMKGITKTIILPFTYTETGSRGLFKGTFIINRLDFGIGGSSWTLSDEVTVTLAIKVLN